VQVGERIEREPKRVVGGRSIVRQRRPQHLLCIVAAKVAKAQALAPGNRPIDIKVGAADQL
jgi:hypothetical protein